MKWARSWAIYKNWPKHQCCQISKAKWNCSRSVNLKRKFYSFHLNQKINEIFLYFCPKIDSGTVGSSSTQGNIFFLQYLLLKCLFNSNKKVMSISYNQTYICDKVHIFWEGHNILQNLVAFSEYMNFM